MIYYIDNLPKKFDEVYMADAITWASEYLQIRFCLSLDLNWRGDMQKDFAGFAGMSEEVEEEYEIEINSKLGLKNTLLTLFHELTHIKQIDEGQLMVNDIGRPSHWLGKKVIPDLKNDSPWEQEAYRNEKLMYELWIEITNGQLQ